MLAQYARVVVPVMVSVTEHIDSGHALYDHRTCSCCTSIGLVAGCVQQLLFVCVSVLRLNSRVCEVLLHYVVYVCVCYSCCIHNILLHQAVTAL